MGKFLSDKIPQEMSCLIISVQHCARATGQEKNNKHLDGKEGEAIPICRWHDLICGKFKGSTKVVLGLKN